MNKAPKMTKITIHLLKKEHDRLIKDFHRHSPTVLTYAGVADK